MNLWETKPDFVNERGVRWWLDRSTTDYARSRIKDAVVWLVQEPDGGMTRLLVVDGFIRYETQSIESMGTYIDLLKLQHDHDSNQAKAPGAVPQGGASGGGNLPGGDGTGGDPGDRIAGHQGRAGSGETGVC